MAPQQPPRGNQPPAVQASDTEEAKKFTRTVMASATKILVQWVGEDRAAEAIGRVATAITASALAAKNPDAFYACTPQSVANVVAVSALTGIMPGTGSGALAYAIPRKARSTDRQPLLNYQLSHRGCNALARRCGQTMIAIPITDKDHIQEDENGDVHIIERALDHPPMTFDDVRGVIVIVKQLHSGLVLSRGWVPRKLIEPRKKMSAAKDDGPWKTWPVEMCMKTAMHYAMSRGWCVIDDTAALEAMALDSDMNGSATIDAPFRRGLTSNPGPAAALESPRDEPETFTPRQEAERETVSAKTLEPTETQREINRQAAEGNAALRSANVQAMERLIAIAGSNVGQLEELLGTIDGADHLPQSEIDRLRAEIVDRLAILRSEREQ